MAPVKLTSAVLLATTLLLCATHSALASAIRCPKGKGDSYLWRVRDNPPAYLFGTVHVANDAVWPSIPSNVKTAWSSSQAVFAELDWSDKQTQREVRRCRHLPEGESLEEILPPEVFTRLRVFMRHVRNALPNWVKTSDLMTALLINYKLKRKQLFKDYVGDWRRKRPIWALLLVNELTREKFENSHSGQTVLDEYLLIRGREAGQVTGALETAEEQCRPLNRLNETVVIQALDTTLQTRLAEDWSAERFGSLVSKTPVPGSMTGTQSLIAAYNCGHFNNKKFLRKLQGRRRVSNETSTVMQEFDHLVEKSLVIGRNRDLAQTVSRLLRVHKTETLFFAMGVAHLVGNNSVVTYLTKMGYVVESIGRSQALAIPPKLEPNINVIHVPGGASMGANGQPGATNVWESVFVAVPGKWTTIATRVNDIFRNSGKTRPATVGITTLSKQVETQTASTPAPAAVNWTSSAVSCSSPHRWTMITLLVTALTSYLL